MHTIRAALLFVFIILAGCMPKVTLGNLLPGSPGATEPIPAKITIHADVDFVPSERAWFSTAANTWRLQTGGLAQVTMVYDLDFTSTSNLRKHVDDGDNLMLRADSFMEIVQKMDLEDCPPDKACVLAWVNPSGGIHNPWHKPVNSVFIPDRYPDAKYATLVILHEMGHMLGLPHLNQVQSIMYPSIVPQRTACLKKADLNAFCDANECGTTILHPCE